MTLKELIEEANANLSIEELEELGEFCQNLANALKEDEAKEK